MTLKKQLFILLTLFFVKLNSAQNPERSVTYERNEDKSITFNYNSGIPGSVLVILDFDQLENASSNIIKKTIRGYSGEIYTLKPINTDEGISFSYSTRMFFGNVDKKPDHKFKYILPFKNGKEVKVRNLSFLGKKFGNAAPKNWRSFQFLAKLNDTVLAVRKGIVISTSDDVEADKTKEYNFKSESNAITIEHKDGTFAKYQVLKDKSIMVDVGDTVYPSTPIALAGSYDLDKNSQLRLSIYYLDKKILKYDFSKRKKESLQNQTHLYSYVNPFFYIKGGSATKLTQNLTYSSTYNDAIIQLEMRKREKKKWKKNGLLVKKR